MVHLCDFYKKDHMYERGLHKKRIAVLAGSRLIRYYNLVLVLLVIATREFCKLWLAFSSPEPTILLAGGSLCKRKTRCDELRCHPSIFVSHVGESLCILRNGANVLKGEKRFHQSFLRKSCVTVGTLFTNFFLPRTQQITF